MSNVIEETYTLPSLGKVYDVEVNPEITLRSMTTADEMKRLGTSEKRYKLMAEIIDDCMTENPGISAYDMCIGDYQFLLHKLRIVTYGPEYEVVSKCPFCGALSRGTLNLEELPVHQFSEDLYDLMEFDLPRTKKHIKLRLQTPRMIDSVLTQMKDFQKRAPSFTGDSAVLFNLKSLIAEIDGEKPNPMYIEDIIRNLPMMDSNYIMRKGQKLNDAIGLDTTLENTCEVCGLDYPSNFRPGSDFFGPAID